MHMARMAVRQAFKDDLAGHVLRDLLTTWSLGVLLHESGVLQACTPCQGPEAPETVRAVWRLVDEYALAESERATLKLLRGLDKHMQHLQSSAATATPIAEAAATAATATTSEARATEVSEAASAASQASHTLPAAQQQAQPASSHDMAQQPDVVQSMALGEQQVPVADQQPAHHQHQHASSELMMSGMQPAPAADQSTFTPNSRQQASIDQNRPQSQGQHRRMPADPRRTATADLAFTSTPGLSATGLPPWQPHPAADPLSAPLLVRASGNGRKEKLEYRLSQNDIHIPSAAELAAVMQQPDRSQPRWTADVYSQSQRASSGYAALQRASADVQIQKPQGRDRSHATWGSSDVHSQKTAARPSMPGSLPATMLEPNGLQQNGLQKPGYEASGLPMTVDVSSSIAATDGMYANPLVLQDNSDVQLHEQDGEVQEHQQGHLQESWQGHQPYQLRHQPSNMVSLIHKADAAQVCLRHACTVAHCAKLLDLQQ